MVWRPWAQYPLNFSHPIALWLEPFARTLDCGSPHLTLRIVAGCPYLLWTMVLPVPSSSLLCTDTSVLTEWINISKERWSYIHIDRVVIIFKWLANFKSYISLEKEMATHSSVLAWRIPWTEETGGLQSTGSQRVGHDWATSLPFPFSLH